MASSPPPGNVVALQQLAQAVQEQLQQQNLQQAQQISEMHQQLLAMQQEIHSLRFNPAAAQQHASASVVAEPARIHNELLRAAKRPDCFRGEHGTHALNWLQEMDIFMENCEPAPSESQKITLAKSFLRDEALRWWCAREKDAQRALASGDASLMLLSPVISSWAAFQSAVKDYFYTRGTSDEARNELHRLRQSQFRNLEAYADRFETVSRRIEVPVGQSIEDELIATFKAGLLNGLVRLSLTSNRPRTLFQAIQQAQQAESDLRVSGASTAAERTSGFVRRGDGDRARRFDGHQFNRFRSGASSLGHSAQQHLSRSPIGSTPMDLSAIADAESETFRNDSESEHGEELSILTSHLPRMTETDQTPSPVSETERQRSPFRSPELSESACSSCQFNAVQVHKTSASSRCRACGHVKPRQTPSSSECWKCGQIGHLRRDCPRSIQDGVAHRDSHDGRQGSTTGKPRHF